MSWGKDFENGVLIRTYQPYISIGWETRIYRSRSWTVVEEYLDENSAKKGHEKWVKTMEENPLEQLHEVPMWKE